MSGCRTHREQLEADKSWRRSPIMHISTLLIESQPFRAKYASFLALGNLPCITYKVVSLFSIGASACLVAIDTFGVSLGGDDEIDKYMVAVLTHCDLLWILVLSLPLFLHNDFQHASSPNSSAVFGPIGKSTNSVQSVSSS